MELALCLSGGGYRAALYHLGVLTILNELRLTDQSVMLDHVHTITSISGGALTGMRFVISEAEQIDRKETFKSIYRDIVDTMKDQGLESELNKTSAVWNSFWNKIGTKGRNYSRIRNTSTAHRDHDFLEQYQTMTTISWGSAFEDISEFNIMYTILRGFLHVFMIKYSEKYNHDVEILLKKH